MPISTITNLVFRDQFQTAEAPLPEPPRPSRPSPGPSGQAFAQDTDDNDEVPF
jgi:hypothetical protein